MDETGETQWRDRFCNAPELEPLPQWSKAKAKQMAAKATRDCYQGQARARVREAAVDKDGDAPAVSFSAWVKGIMVG